RDTQRRETALSSLSSLFLLSCSLAHRDLHSFPTRRSSDLSLFGEAGQALLYARVLRAFAARRSWWTGVSFYDLHDDPIAGDCGRDRKSTRLNSSHLGISYAVFCLKKKKTSHYSPSHNIIQL